MIMKGWYLKIVIKTILFNAIEAVHVVVDHLEKITGKCSTGFVSKAVPIDASIGSN